MLFNSTVFIFLFMPIVLLAYYGSAHIGKLGHGRRLQLAILLASSIFFYAYWPGSMLSLFVSLVVNLAFGHILVRYCKTRFSVYIYALSIITNLGLLAHYKYYAFILDNVASLLHVTFSPVHVELPLGISFFTFTQIAFLTDIYRRRIEQYSALEYLNIICLFPHLVAGPVLYHHSMLPQLRDDATYKAEPSRFAIGIILFCIGLFKKSAVADTVAPYANAIFEAVASGGIPDAGQAWRGALLYSLQLYFDFSGYSDMALGLGSMLGFRLPLNFYSPYKAENISDFWRRWHMSLGYFLKHYLYIPLGGNAKGFTRKLVNLFVVMVLCGLWHGAGWTFVAWGFLHGVLLVLYSLYRAGCGDAVDRLTGAAAAATGLLGRLLTFTCVVAGWVIFRSPDFETARVMLLSMCGMASGKLQGLHVGYSEVLILALLPVCWFLPNSFQLLQEHVPAANVPSSFLRNRISEALAFRPNWAWAAAASVLFLVGLSAMLCTGTSPYLYFTF